MSVTVTDQFSSLVAPGKIAQRSRSDPPNRWVVTTPSDTDELPYLSQQIRVATGGTMTVVLPDGTNAVLTFEDGETRLVECKQIKATGTSGVATIEVGYVIP